MLKKVTFYFGLALAMKVNAFAWVGGPFSNGGFDTLIEQNGVYQATFSFKNGSGYAYFTPDNDITPSVGTGTAAASTTTLSSENRSILYYKGITFVGMATGTSDIDKRKISGYTNGYSEYTASTTSTDDDGTVSSSGTIVSNTGGFSYTANVNFTAKITNTHPQIRFRGKGELAVISPNGDAAASEIIAALLEENFTALNEQISETTTALVEAILPEDPLVPMTPEDILALLPIIDQIQDNAAQRYADLRAAAASEAAGVLTPLSIEEIAANYTEFVDVRVTGVLRTF